MHISVSLEDPSSVQSEKQERNTNVTEVTTFRRFDWRYVPIRDFGDDVIERTLQGRFAGAKGGATDARNATFPYSFDYREKFTQSSSERPLPRRVSITAAAPR
jgi:hypothetical protein